MDGEGQAVTAPADNNPADITPAQSQPVPVAAAALAQQDQALLQIGEDGLPIEG